MKKILFIASLIGLFAFTSVFSNQILKTSLVITVRDDTGNLVKGALVQLYKKEQNYLQEVNAIKQGVTNKKGVVKFKKLQDLSYFVLVRKGDINNAGGGERTDVLKKGMINKVTIIIQ